MIFPSRTGSRLVGVWHRAGGNRLTIVCHGMQSSKEGTKSVRLAEDLAARGCDALRFDFSFVGESEGEFGDLTVSGEVEDLRGAWDWARLHCAGPIAVVGSSLGGTVALLFSATEHRVAAVATIAAVASPARLFAELPAADRERWRREGWLEWRGMKLRASFLEDAESLRLLEDIPRVCCPVLLTHGTADGVVPVSDVDLLDGSLRTPHLVRKYEGADHRFSDPHLLDRLLSDLTLWICAQTLPETERSSSRRP